MRREPCRSEQGDKVPPRRRIFDRSCDEQGLQDSLRTRQNRRDGNQARNRRRKCESGKRERIRHDRLHEHGSEKAVRRERCIQTRKRRADGERKEAASLAHSFGAPDKRARTNGARVRLASKLWNLLLADLFAKRRYNESRPYDGGSGSRGCKGD